MSALLLWLLLGIGADFFGPESGTAANAATTTTTSTTVTTLDDGTGPPPPPPGPKQR